MASQNQSIDNVEECNEVCTFESTTLCKSEKTSNLDDNKLTNEGKRQKSDTCMQYCNTCHSQMSETDTEQHKGHGIISLSTAANRLKQTLEESITKIKRKNEKLHKSCLENIEQNNDENVKLKIESLHHVLNDEYRRVERVFQDSFGSAKRDRESQYEKYLKDLQNTRSSLDENIRTLDEISNEIEKCSDADLLRKEATFNKKMENCETVQHLPLFDIEEATSIIQALYSEKDKENLKQTAKEHEQLRKEREYFENGFETVMSLLKSLLDYRGNNKKGIGFFSLPALPGGMKPYLKKMAMKDRRQKANDDLNRFRNIAVKLIDFERVKEQVEVDSNEEPKTKDSTYESTTTESETQIEDTKETIQKVKDQNARMKTIIKTIGEWINICHKSVKQSEVDKIELTLPSEHVMNDQGKKTLETYRKKLEDICQRQTEKQLLASSKQLLEETCDMIACEVTHGYNTAEEIFVLVVAIKTKIVNIESQCLDISKQICSLKDKFGVKPKGVYGGIASMPLWKDILDSILKMKSDTDYTERMSRETKAQVAIHGNVYQHNTKTHNRGPMPEIHKATVNKEGSSSTGQNENLTEKHEEKVQALQKEIDDLKKELKKRTDENKTLRDDVDSIKEENKQLQKEFDKLQKELDIENRKEHMETSKGQKETTDDKKSKNKGAPTKNEDEHIDSLKNELKEEKDRSKQLKQDIKKSHEEIIKLQDNVDYWKNRVSKIAGSKLTDNNPGITDLSDPNRPTRLAEIFGEIYDNVWTNTLEGLNGTKKIKTEKEAVLHMASILKVCYVCCENKFDETLEQMRMVLLLKSQKKSGDAELDKGEEKQLKDMLKSVGVRTSKCLDQDDLMKCVTDRNLQKAMEKYQAVSKDFTKDMQKHQAVTKDFTKQCLEICWLMVIQDPPVVLYWGDSTVGSPIDADRFKAFTRSGDSLEYIVWPAVLLHTNGPLLNKGIVQPEELDTKP